MKNNGKVGLGGGCHWCTEAIFQSLIGVEKVEQGWISAAEDPTCSEAVIVHFNPLKISLTTLILIHLHTHSATSLHPMRAKYRSAIYTFSLTQQAEAKQILKRCQRDFNAQIITSVYTFKSFELNKVELLNYYYSNPAKPFCQRFIDPKLRWLLQNFDATVDINKFSVLIS